MSKERKEDNSGKLPPAGMAAIRESYDLAKLIRQGNRELERQYNSKKTRREK